MKNHLTKLFILPLLSLIFACSGPGPLNRAIIRSSTKENLLKAGFQPLPVSEQQQWAVSGFIPGKITSIQRHRTIYYVYPDLDQNRILIGSQQAYTHYQQIVASQLTRTGKPKTQLKQDWAESGVWKN